MSGTKMQNIAKRFYFLIFQKVKPIWISDRLRNDFYSHEFCQLPKPIFHDV